MIAASRDRQKSRDVAHRERVQNKERSERGLRHRVQTKQSKLKVVQTHQAEVTAEYQADLSTKVRFTPQQLKTRRVRLAMRRRGQLGMNRKKKHGGSNQGPVSSSSRVDVKVLWHQFRRTGRIPSCDVQAIRDGNHEGVTADQVKQLIRAKLIRGGIEENPGPPSSSSTDPVPPIHTPPTWVEKGKDKALATPQPPAPLVVVDKVGPHDPKNYHQFNGRCFNCGELGHSANKCPRPKNPEKTAKERRKRQLDHAGLVAQAQWRERQKYDAFAEADDELRIQNETIQHVHTYVHPPKEEKRPVVVRPIQVPQMQNFTVRFGDCQYTSFWKVAYKCTAAGVCADLGPNERTSVFGAVMTNVLKCVSLVGSVSAAAMCTKLAAGSRFSQFIGRAGTKILSLMGIVGATVVGKTISDHFHATKGRVRTYRFDHHIANGDLLGGLGPNPQVVDPVDPQFQSVHVTDVIFSADTYLGLTIPRVTRISKDVFISRTLFRLLLQKSVRLRNKSRSELIDSLSLYAEGCKDVPIPLYMETGRRALAAETVDVVADWLISSPQWSLGGDQSALTY